MSRNANNPKAIQCELCGGQATKHGKSHGRKKTVCIF